MGDEDATRLTWSISDIPWLPQQHSPSEKSALEIDQACCTLSIEPFLPFSLADSPPFTFAAQERFSRPSIIGKVWLADGTGLR